jgi:ABC-type tungstate transport system substrate-binding protein
MKKLIFKLLTIISSIAFAVGSIWVIVSFLIYLVKDNPFSWASLWFTISSLIGCFLFLILDIIIQVKNKKKEPEATGTTFKGKSKFQQRLEEAQRIQRSRQ